jgi:membrane protein YdbS with pleckstrin-like domain
MPVLACPDCNRDVSTLATSCPHCGRPMTSGPNVLPLAAPIHDAPSPVSEETLWHGTPSAVVLLGKLVQIVLALIVIPLAAAFFAKNSTDLDTASGFTKAGWAITAVVVLYLIVRALFVLSRIRSTIYTITNQRVMIERGLLSKSLSEIDLRYLDESQFHQGALDRMLAIGDVTLISSDKSLPVYTLHGIKDPRGIRELIRSHAYQVSQRQLFTRAT